MGKPGLKTGYPQSPLKTLRGEKVGLGKTKPKNPVGEKGKLPSGRLSEHRSERSDAPEPSTLSRRCQKARVRSDAPESRGDV